MAVRAEYKRKVSVRSAGVLANMHLEFTTAWAKNPDTGRECYFILLHPSVPAEQGLQAIEKLSRIFRAADVVQAKGKDRFVIAIVPKYA